MCLNRLFLSEFVDMLAINEIKINWETNQCLEGDIPNSQKGKDLMMDLDLNYPPVLSLSLAVTPSCIDHQNAQAEVRRQIEPQTSKDFDVIDDEVVIISPRRFAEVCTFFRVTLLFVWTCLLINQYLCCIRPRTIQGEMLR